MAEDRSIDLIDYLLIFARRKKFLLSLGAGTLILSYLIIFLFVTPKYGAQALIIPNDQEQIGGIASLLKNFSNMPVNIPGLKKSSNVNLYTTIIYSRTTLENLINKFKLHEDYDLESREKVLKALTDNINTEETQEGAFIISVLAKTPEKSAEMTNYLVSLLNEKIIQLEIAKAKDNRQFMEKRYHEISADLKLSEEKLRDYQKSSGLLEAENQTKSIIETYSKMESELATKEIEFEVTRKIMGESAPATKNSQIALNEFKSKFSGLKKGAEKDGFLLAPRSIPDKAIEYYRLYRNVKISEAMLEFVIPIYEQAKLDEQKEIPVLQIIDNAVPPEKRVYPKRVLTSVIITAVTMFFTMLFILSREIIGKSVNPKVGLLFSELSFRRKQ